MRLFSREMVGGVFQAIQRAQELGGDDVIAPSVEVASAEARAHILEAREALGAAFGHMADANWHQSKAEDKRNRKQ